MRIFSELGDVLGVLGVSWVHFGCSGGGLGTFLGVCASFGFHFGGSGVPLGLILGALGSPWAPFWTLWGSLGLHFGGSGDRMGAFGGPGGRPWPPKGPKANFFQFFPPILGHFGSSLEAKSDKKSDVIFD